MSQAVCKVLIISGETQIKSSSPVYFLSDHSSLRRPEGNVLCTVYMIPDSSMHRRNPGNVQSDRLRQTSARGRTYVRDGQTDACDVASITVKAGCAVKECKVGDTKHPVCPASVGKSCIFCSEKDEDRHFIYQTKTYDSPPNKVRHSPSERPVLFNAAAIILRAWDSRIPMNSFFRTSRIERSVACHRL